MNITLYQMIPELNDNRLLFEPLNAIRVTFGDINLLRKNKGG